MKNLTKLLIFGLLLFLFTFSVHAATPTLPVPADGTYELTFSYPIGRVVAGDFNGDGILDFAAKTELAGANQTYRIEARLNNGTKLWEFDTGARESDAYSPHEIPLISWDLNNDGKWEAYFQYRKNNTWWHRIVDGQTGTVLADAELPWWDNRKSMAAVAYKSGVPRIVWTLDRVRAQMFETWNGSNFSLDVLWDYYSGTVVHDMFRAADIDQNGSDDEILQGCTTLNSDGSVRYSISGCGGTDQVLLGYFHPDYPNDLIVVTGDANKRVAAYWADTGQDLWNYYMPDYFSAWTHFHTGWLKNESDGAKLLVIDRDTPNWMYLEVKNGAILGQGTSGAPSCSGRPIKWNGDNYDDCVGRYGELGRVDLGGPGCEEVLEKSGNTLLVEFNTSCSADTPSRWQNRNYRQDAVLTASGYAPYWLGGVVIGSAGPPPTSRPTNTPAPTATPGDLDKDSDVDIFDYNLMIENFGSTSCGNIADIDGNCRVDIFDYNKLVENFGKTQ